MTKQKVTELRPRTIVLAVQMALLIMRRSKK